MKLLNNQTVLKTLVFFIFIFPTFSHALELIFPDFDQSLMRHGRSKKSYHKLYTYLTDDPHLLEMRKVKNEFKNIYDKYRVKFKSDLSAPPRIPKIVHQIWLGSEVPEKFHLWMKTWMKLNLHGWEYKLWTDKEVANFPLHNQELYDQAKSYGEKSDILRYEILYHQGGLYIDVDFENKNSLLFTKLNNSYDFYVGFEPIEHKQPSISSPLIGNAVIASIPGHPILENVILDMDAHYQKHSDEWAVVTTGPIYFTKKIIEYNRSEKSIKYNNIFLPTTFFFPLTYSDIRSSRFQENLKKLIKPETAAIHYWSGSWLE